MSYDLYAPGIGSALSASLLGSFILQELHDEFRNPTERLFPMEQRMAHKTWILEFTWREKSDSLITV